MTEFSTVPTGPNGHDAKGRFTPGNRAAKGNPLARKAQQLRSAMLKAVSVSDLRAVTKAMLTKAKDGDTAAARLIYSYSLGEPQPWDLLERLENLEAMYGHSEKA